MKAIKIKFRKEWLLWIAAVALTVFIVGYTVYAVRSLAKVVGAAFIEEPVTGTSEASFDFESLNNILRAKGLAVPVR